MFEPSPEKRKRKKRGKKRKKEGKKEERKKEGEIFVEMSVAYDRSGSEAP